MDAKLKEKCDKMVAIQKRAIALAKKGDEENLQEALEDKKKLKKQILAEPEYVNESTKETLAKAAARGESPLSMRAVRKTVDGRRQVNEALSDFQDRADTIKLGWKIVNAMELRKSDGEGGLPRTLEALGERSTLWREYINDFVAEHRPLIEAEVAKSGKVKKANVIYTTNTGYGAEWIPEIWSRELIDVPHLPHVLLQAGGISLVRMPTKNYTYSAFSGDINLLIGSEQSATGPAPTTGVGAIDAGTTEVNFVAKKLEGLVTLSTEQTEDSVFNAVEAFRMKLRNRAAQNLEEVIINGATGTHIDSDIAALASTDRRKWFDGLRKLEDTTNARVDLGTLTTAKVLSLRNELSKGFRARQDCVYITGPKSGALVGGLTEFVSVEKYGPTAFILTGEIGKIGGCSVIESEEIRETLNASGVYDGTTQTKTMMLCVNRQALAWGWYKNLEVIVVPKPEYDCVFVIARMRGDFQPMHSATTYKLVALGYNMA